MSWPAESAIKPYIISHFQWLYYKALNRLLAVSPCLQTEGHTASAPSSVLFNQAMWMTPPA